MKTRANGLGMYNQEHHDKIHTQEKKSTDLDVHAPNVKTFFQLLGNTLFVSVIDYMVWFAITFYTYIQAQSVAATAIIAGIF